MNRYIKLIIACGIIGSLSTSSCKKGVDDPEFDITFNEKVYAINEPIKFNILGGADLITFYSGEVGKEYRYRERFRVDGKPTMSFTSYSQNTPQANSLSLLVSTDFNGANDIDNLQKATWKDITSRATLSTGTDNTPSGTIDLTDIQVPDVPVYFAFKYVAKQGAVAQPTWTIKNIVINNTAPDGTLVPVATTANLTWGAINITGAQTWNNSTTQSQFVGGGVNVADNEDWTITRGLQLDRVQRSFGVNVKSNPTSKITSYDFTGFTAAGTYTATFEATNSNIDNIKRAVKEFTITVK
jgi:hypothetical protein